MSGVRTLKLVLMSSFWTSGPNLNTSGKSGTSQNTEKVKLPLVLKEKMLWASPQDKLCSPRNAFSHSSSTSDCPLWSNGFWRYWKTAAFNILCVGTHCFHGPEGPSFSHDRARRCPSVKDGLPPVLLFPSLPGILWHSMISLFLFSQAKPRIKWKLPDVYKMNKLKFTYTDLWNITNYYLLFTRDFSCVK